MKKFIWSLFTTLLIVVCLSALYLFLPQTFLSLDNRLRDFLFVLRGPIPVSNDVIIIDIDEKSLKAEGQWPWPRKKVAQLITNLSNAEAGIIGLDIVFSEPDQTSPHTIASLIDYNGSDLEDYDQILADTVAVTPTIGGYFFSFLESNESRAPMVPAVFVEKGLSDQHYILSPSKLVLNVPVIQDSFYSSGFFNNTPDEGGMIRRVPLLMRFNDSLYPSLDLEMFRIYTGAQKVVVNNSITGVESITVGEVTIPTDRFARIMVNYHGPAKSFEYISATDILHHNFDSEKIRGKFLLVGTSAVGLSDLRATPFDTLMPGIEVHANVIENLLSQDFLSLSENAELIDLAAIFVVVSLVITMLSFLNVWLIIPFFIALIYSSYLFFNYMLFTKGAVLNILFPLAALVISFMASLFLDYIFNLRQKQQIMAIFAKKVSKNVMNDLIEHSSEALLHPRNREVTVFFSDIRSFTSISEQLGNPEYVINLLNRYMTPMVENINTHQGTVDKFIGDAIMAYWNAPTLVPEHADKALTSAIEQIELLQIVNVQLKKEFNIAIAIGIGINTGEATIGEMGSSGRSDYTIIGDNVNLASRLEGLNKLYGSSILISEATRKKLTRTYRLRPVDIVRVKGKKEAIEIFEVLTSLHPASQKESELYEKALSHYRQKELEKALALFDALEKEYSSVLYRLYIQRIQEALQKGIDSFDVITTMYTK